MQYHHWWILVWSSVCDMGTGHAQFRSSGYFNHQFGESSVSQLKQFSNVSLRGKLPSSCRAPLPALLEGLRSFLEMKDILSTTMFLHSPYCFTVVSGNKKKKLKSRAARERSKVPGLWWLSLLVMTAINCLFSCLRIRCDYKQKNQN